VNIIVCDNLWRICWQKGM